LNFFKLDKVKCKLYYRLYLFNHNIHGIDRKNKILRTHEGSRLLGVHIGVYQLHPDLKRTLVAMSERTGMSVSQVTDESAVHRLG